MGHDAHAHAISELEGLESLRLWYLIRKRKENKTRIRQMKIELVYYFTS